MRQVNRFANRFALVGVFFCLETAGAVPSVANADEAADETLKIAAGSNHFCVIAGLGA